jgi:hypothetical protein
MKPFNAGPLKMHYYAPAARRTEVRLVPRNELSFHNWRSNVEELKRTGETAHAAALEKWGLAHFGGVIDEMLEAFLASHAATGRPGAAS